MRPWYVTMSMSIGEARSRRADATAMSESCPGVRWNAQGLQSGSLKAWISAVRPPHERPIACPCSPFPPLAERCALIEVEPIDSMRHGWEPKIPCLIESTDGIPSGYIRSMPKEPPAPSARRRVKRHPTK
jgi:hypothetical protein